jgi:hypothetical protein
MLDTQDQQECRNRMASVHVLRAFIESMVAHSLYGGPALRGATSGYDYALRGLGGARYLQVIQPTNMLSRPSLRGNRYWKRPAQFISCEAVHMSYTTRYLFRVRKYT